jgi:hypothetical protein
MRKAVWRNPNPPFDLYQTTIVNDPNVPAGYVRVGLDGSFDRPMQNYQPGAASGGWPSYPTPQSGETVKQMLMRINGTAPQGGGY